MGEDPIVTDKLMDLLKLRISGVLSINGWKGTGKAKKDTGEKYPMKKNPVYEGAKVAGESEERDEDEVEDYEMRSDSEKE